MKSCIQDTVIKNLYEGGCYFLCLCQIAEIKNRYLIVDIVNFAQECIEAKWMKEDFTVIRPDLILGKLLGRRVSVIKIDATEDISNFEYFAKVNCWYNEKTKLTHFNLSDWDSLSDSKTVKHGRIISYRLFI